MRTLLLLSALVAAALPAHAQRSFVPVLSGAEIQTPSCRLLTLDDSVEFFNTVLETKLSAEEKKDLARFLQAL